MTLEPSDRHPEGPIRDRPSVPGSLAVPPSTDTFSPIPPGGLGWKTPSLAAPLGRQVHSMGTQYQNVEELLLGGSLEAGGARAVRPDGRCMAGKTTEVCLGFLSFLLLQCLRF